MSQSIRDEFGRVNVGSLGTGQQFYTAGGSLVELTGKLSTKDAFAEIRHVDDNQLDWISEHAMVRLHEQS